MPWAWPTALGQLPAALLSLRAAVRSAEAAALPEAAAEVRMSLAFALLERGRSTAALAEADRAAAALTGTAAARLHAQRAVVLQRCGRLLEALEEYRVALPVLQRDGDALWEARLRNNRGLLHKDRGDLDAAEADLTRAGEIHSGLGNDLLAADAIWGRGDVAALRGDIRTALVRYDEAALAWAGSGVPVPELLVDRAGVLLRAGLLPEVQENADQAVEELGALLRDTDLAKAQVLQAQIALARDEPARAIALATDAEERLRRQRRPGWVLVARYVRLRAAAAEGVDVDGRAAARTAVALEAAGWRALALDARIISAQAALTAGDLAAAQEQLGHLRAARRGTVELRVRGWYAEALLREASGRRRGASSALRAGMRAVEAHRASLGATELRVLASSYAEPIGRLGVQAALRRRDAGEVLAWSEAVRAGAVRLRPVTPPRDDDLAGLLTQLRQVTADLEGARLRSAPIARLTARQAALERRVRESSHRVESIADQTARAVASVSELRDAVGTSALVSYLTLDRQLHAVTSAGGRLRLHALGGVEPAERALGIAHFALRRLAAGHGSAAAQAAALRSCASAAASLDRLLLSPLRSAVGDRPLVVVPTAALHTVPWALLPSVRGRPLVVSPSATMWRAAATRADVRVLGRGLVVLGPGVPAAEREVAAVARLHPQAERLSGAEAGVRAVLAALGQADWGHIAAHGRLRADNAMFSSIQLADGSLTVYELERLRQVPATVLLPACQSGVGVVQAGEEVLGLATALLSLGTRTVVATVIAVPDEATSDLMVALHSRLAAGAGLPEGLALAQEALPRDDPATVAAAAGFVCIGA